MSEPVLQMTVMSNLWVKMMHFKKAGDVMLGHKHAFDHPTLLSKGSVEVDIEGITTIFKAPTLIFISKDKIHKLTALEDDTIASCIHALRADNKSEDIIDPTMIPKNSTLESLTINKTIDRLTVFD